MEADWVTASRYPDGSVDTMEFNDSSDLHEYLEEAIRRFGRDNVAVYKNISLLSIGLDMEDIESDRYPELDMAMDAGLVEFYRGSRLLFTRPIEDLPHNIISSNLESILKYLKEAYDDSLIDTYYLQE